MLPDPAVPPDARVVGHTQRSDRGLRLLDASQVPVPVVPELVTQERSRRMQMRIPTMPLRAAPAPPTPPYYGHANRG